MSAYSEHEKAVRVNVAKQDTRTADDLDLGRDHVGLKPNALAALLAVAIVGLPLIADWLATGLIGPELIP